MSVLALVLALSAASCGGDALQNANQTETPETPDVKLPPSKGAYKHVVILGVDGGGTFFKDTPTPRCDEIFKDGATSYSVLTSDPTISAQCWGSMLHSVLPEFHRLSNQIVADRAFDPESDYPSIFRVVREAMPKAPLASFCNWAPINKGIIENNLGVTMGSGDDAAVARQVVSYLKTASPTLLFVQFDSVDAAGHASGYGSETHLTALSVVDALIGLIYDALAANGMLDDTLLMVTADHGGTPAGSHGGDSDAEKYIFLGVRGKTVAKNAVIEEAVVRDIAAIGAYALGLEFPETWTGHVPTGVFYDVTATARKEMEIPVSVTRDHKTVPTPALSAFTTLMQGHTLLAYLPFDDSPADTLEQIQTSRSGNLYFYDAYFGKGVALDDGYVTLEDLSVGKGSFSAAFWLKTGGVPDDPCLLANKDWNSGLNDGFALSLRPNDIKFNAGSKSLNVRMDLEAPLPLDYKEGWMHVTLTVDRTAGKVRICYDFKKAAETDIPASLQDVSFDGLKLNVGQDGRGNYGHTPVQMDELFLTADVLTDADLEALKAYYQ